MTYAETKELLEWAVKHRVQQIQIGEVSCVFQLTEPETPARPTPRIPKMSEREWVDRELFGQSLDVVTSA